MKKKIVFILQNLKMGSRKNIINYANEISKNNYITYIMCLSDIGILKK